MKRRKGCRMSCDVGEATEGSENELWRRWSDGRVGEWAHLRHRNFTYVTWRAALAIYKYKYIWSYKTLTHTHTHTYIYIYIYIYIIHLYTDILLSIFFNNLNMFDKYVQYKYKLHKYINQCTNYSFNYRNCTTMRKLCAWVVPVGPIYKILLLGLFILPQSRTYTPRDLQPKFPWVRDL